MDSLLEQQLLGNSLLRWSVALGVALGLVTLALLVRRALARRRLTRPQEPVESLPAILAEVLGRTRKLTLFVLATAAGARALVLPGDGALWLARFTVLALALQVGQWLTNAFGLLLARREASGELRPEARTMSAATGFALNLVVWTVLTLMVLSNFGIEISALIAGLGIGGIAAALAVQNTLGDLFSALAIYTDRPFDIGDSIAVGELQGTVTQIGWRTTHLRASGGEMIVLANSDLARARIRNFRRMHERRVVLPLGLEYGLRADQVEWVPRFAEETISSIDGLRFERAHFKGFGASSLDFEVVYYVTSADYRTYMDAQQRLLLTIYRRFEEERIGFAFPTQTLRFVPGAPETPAVPPGEREPAIGQSSD